MDNNSNNVRVITSNVSDVAQSLRGYISVCCGKYKSLQKGNIDSRNLDKVIKEMQSDFTRFCEALLI